MIMVALDDSLPVDARLSFFAWSLVAAPCRESAKRGLWLLLS